MTPISRLQILNAVIAQIDAVEQNPARRRVIEARDQLDDRRLALPVFTDQRDALPGSMRRSRLSSTRRELPG